MSSQNLQEDVMNLNLKYIEKREAILPCCRELSMNSLHLGERSYESIQSNLLRIYCEPMWLILKNQFAIPK